MFLIQKILCSKTTGEYEYFAQTETSTVVDKGVSFSRLFLIEATRIKIKFKLIACSLGYTGGNINVEEATKVSYTLLQLKKYKLRYHLAGGSFCQSSFGPERNESPHSNPEISMEIV